MLYSMNLLYAEQQGLIAVYGAVIQLRLEELLNHKIYSESSNCLSSKIKSSTDTGLHAMFKMFSKLKRINNRSSTEILEWLCEIHGPMKYFVLDNTE